MAGVTFVPYDATFFAGVGEHEGASPGLLYGVRLASGESMKLTTDEKFEELDGGITIFGDGDSVKDKQKGVGVLRYFEAGDDAGNPSVAHYTAEIHISGDQFNELVFAARLGRLPSEIVIDVESLKQDSQHYVRRKTWDNKTSPQLAITTANFSVPLVISVPSENPEDYSSAMATPPTRAQFDRLLIRLEDIRAEIKHMLVLLLLSVLALVGLFLILKI